MENASAAVNPAEKFLTQMGVDYTVRSDGSLVVRGDLDISNRGLTQLPDLSRVTVTGNFSCADNDLSSLKGAPLTLGNFDCSGNGLKSLSSLSQKFFLGDFKCQYNDLADLKGGPEEVQGSYWAQHNHVATLEGGPKKVGKDFLCYDNGFDSVAGGPQTGGYFNAGSDRFNDEIDRLQASFAATPKPDKQPGEPAEPAGITNAQPAPVQSKFTAGPAAEEDEEQKPVLNTRFSTPTAMAKLLAAHQLIQDHFDVDKVDTDRVKVKDANYTRDGLVVQLQNDHNLLCTRANGQHDFIGQHQAGTQFEPADAAAIVSLAKSGGMKQLHLHGNDEQKAFLYLEARKQGLGVDNPPPQTAITAARQTLAAQTPPPPPRPGVSAAA